MVNSCFNEDMVRSRMTTMPPPSTVSTVLANKLGVKASKSLKKINIKYSRCFQPSIDKTNQPSIDKQKILHLSSELKVFKDKE